MSSEESEIGNFDVSVSEHRMTRPGRVGFWAARALRPAGFAGRGADHGLHPLRADDGVPVGALAEELRELAELTASSKRLLVQGNGSK